MVYGMSNIEAVEARISRLCIGASPVWLRIEALRELSRLRAAWDIGTGRWPIEHRFLAIQQVQESGHDGLRMVELAHEALAMSSSSFDAFVQAWTADSDEEFTEAPTVQIPSETMHDLVYGEGHVPVGPRCATREMRGRRDPRAA